MKKLIISMVLVLLLMPVSVCAVDDPKDLKACEEARKESKEKRLCHNKWLIFDEK